MYRKYIALPDLIEATQPISIHVLAKKRDEQDLAGLVEGVAMKAGMAKVYAE